VQSLRRTGLGTLPNPHRHKKSVSSVETPRGASKNRNPAEPIHTGVVDVLVRTIGRRSTASPICRHLIASSSRYLTPSSKSIHFIPAVLQCGRASFIPTNVPGVEWILSAWLSFFSLFMPPRCFRHPFWKKTTAHPDRCRMRRRSYDKNETVMPLIPLLPSCGRGRQSSSQIWGFRFSLFLFSIHVDDKQSAW